MKLHALALFSAYCSLTFGQPGFLSLDGNNDYAERNNLGIGRIIPDSSDFTVDLWFAMCANQGIQQLFDSRGSTAGDGIEIDFNSQTDLRVRTKGDLPGTHTSNTFTVGTVLGEWHHLAVTYRESDTSWNVFFDGTSVGTFLGSFKPRDRIIIGKTDHANTWLFNGRVDDIRISDNIRYSTNFSPTPNPAVDPNTLALWKFDEGQGATSFDDLGPNDWDMTGYSGAHVNDAEFVVPTQSACTGDSVQLSAAGGTTFWWIPTTGLSDEFAANPKALPAVTTQYTVMVGDTNGCVYTDSVLVIVGVAPPVTASATEDTICLGDATFLNATGADHYMWMPDTGLSGSSVPNPAASPMVTTTYTVVGTDSSGCQDVDSVTIVVLPAPSINVSVGDDTICLGGSTQLTATGALTYSWMPTTGLDDPSSATPMANPTTTTSYTVTGTNGDSCSRSESATITVVVCSGVEDLSHSIVIRPNPASSFVQLDLPPGTSGYRCILYNGLGQVVLDKTLDSNSSTLPLNRVQPGSYSLYVRGGEHLWRKTLIVQ